MAFIANSDEGTAPLETHFGADMALLNDDQGEITPIVDKQAPGKLKVVPPAEGPEEVLDHVAEPEKGEGDGTEEGEPEVTKEEENLTPPTTLHPRPTVTDIKAKYPDFFKNFPDMRHVLFREQEYATLFPTVEDAKEAQGKSEDFGHFATLLQSGKSEDFDQFLSGIKQGGPDHLTNMAANFLPALYRADRDMYFQVTTPIAESLVRNAYKAALQSGNENLQNAAEHLALWAMGDAAYARGEKTTPPLAVKEAARDPKFEQEKKEFYDLKYNETRNFVGGQSTQRLTAEIKKSLDPNGVFNEFTSKLLMKEILQEIGDTLEKDERHMRNMNSLWAHAKKAGFAGDWKDRILTTYLSRARAIMPAIRARIREGALADQQGRVRTQSERAGRSADRREVSGSGTPRGSGPNGAPTSSKSIDWKNTSDLDFLNDKVTFKK